MTVLKIYVSLSVNHADCFQWMFMYQYVRVACLFLGENDYKDKENPLTAATGFNKRSHPQAEAIL